MGLGVRQIDVVGQPIDHRRQRVEEREDMRGIRIEDVAYPGHQLVEDVLVQPAGRALHHAVQRRKKRHQVVQSLSEIVRYACDQAPDFRERCDHAGEFIPVLQPVRGDDGAVLEQLPIVGVCLVRISHHLGETVEHLLESGADTIE